MSKILVSIIFLIFISFNGISQNYNVDFIEYSRLVQEAESNILKENFRKALVNYKNAFELCKPIASNVFTALQVAAFKDKKKTFKGFVKKGFKVGLEVRYLKSDSLLNYYILENKLDSFLLKNYTKNHLKYLNSLNEYLLDSINQISKVDNNFKTMYLDSLSQIDSTHSKIYEKKYDSIVSNLVENQLIPLIKNYGFPGQRLTGINKVGQKNDPYNYSFSNNKALFVLLHYYSSPKSCNYNSLYKREVLNGNMRPEVFASIIDFQYKYGNNEYCNVESFNQWWKNDDETQFEKINLSRKLIGLGTFQELKKKNKRGLKICYKYDEHEYKHIKLFYWCG